MPYPKAVKQDTPDYSSTAPAAPTTARVVAPQVSGVGGGAPRVKSQRSYFEGATGRSDYQVRTPVPPAMSLPEAQKQLQTLSAAVKDAFDARKAALPENERQSSRFWRMYEQYAEQAATLVARRIWTDQMARTGNVADWMSWLNEKGV